MKRRNKLGRVVSNKMDKTVVVTVESSRHHPLYKKTVKTIARYKAHDERNQCQPGDVVRLAETRPLSKEKRWRVVEIVTRAEVIEVKPEEIEVEVKPGVADVQPQEAAVQSEETT